MSVEPITRLHTFEGVCPFCGMTLDWRTHTSAACIWVALEEVYREEVMIEPTRELWQRYIDQRLDDLLGPPA